MQFVRKKSTKAMRKCNNSDVITLHKNNETPLTEYYNAPKLAKLTIIIINSLMIYNEGDLIGI